MTDDNNIKAIVINRCYGGFSLSHAAFVRLRELGQQEALAEPNIGEGWRSGQFASLRNKSFGHEIPRDDPLLIQVVLELGKAANGDAANLKLVHIPANVAWEIQGYDGMEWVAEQHHTWHYEGDDDD